MPISFSNGAIIVYKLFFSITIPLLMAGCAPTITKSTYDYSYISSTETFATTRRNIGEIYILNPADADPKLSFVDNVLAYNTAELQSSPPANIVSSRVSGAQVTLNIPQKGEATGSASFDTSVENKSFVLKSLSRSQIAAKIEDLYTELNKLRSASLPLDARRVVDDKLLYVVVSGVGTADLFKIKHGTAQGKKTGATITVNGQTYLDVTVDRTNVFDCNKSEQIKVQCTADITVYSARFDQREGETFLNIVPTSVSKAILTKALQNTFSN